MIAHIPKPDPEAEAEFQQIVLRVMVLVLFTDFVVDTDELKVVARIHSDLVGQPVSADAVLAELHQSRDDGVGLIDTLQQHAYGLTDHDKDFLIQAAFAVCAGNEHMSDAENEVLRQMSRVLNIPRERFDELYAGLSDMDW